MGHVGVKWVVVGVGWGGSCRGQSCKQGGWGG